MRRYDYSFLANDLLPADLLGLTQSISELKTLSRIRENDYKSIFTKLESIAKVQSVKGSNAIEGIVTTDKRIEEIVNKSSAPLNHSEMEIAGYRDALNAVHDGYKTLDLNIDDILGLHRLVLSYTVGSDGGQFKSEDNVIMETDALGNRKIRFAPVAAHDTNAAMEQFTFAYMDARHESSINKLLLIPCVILDFLCIHPFSDGNGRMSRLLSLLLLYKNGYDAGKYVSFEEQINKNKAMYYEALKQSSEGWHDNNNSYMPFIRNFVTTLYLCYKELDKRFAVVHGKTVSKTARVEATVLNNLLPISKKEISLILPDVSLSTIESVLARMLNNNEIKKIGDFKNAKYVKVK